MARVAFFTWLFKKKLKFRISDVQKNGGPQEDIQTNSCAEHFKTYSTPPQVGALGAEADATETTSQFTFNTELNTLQRNRTALNHKSSIDR